MNVLLIATYEQGHQPFGLASPAAWLRNTGARVACLDVSRDPLDETTVREAGLIAVHIPMHTATRLAIELIAPIRAINPSAHLCFYGLYASVNAGYLRKRGVQTILGGEFEEGLAALATSLAKNGDNRREHTSQRESLVSLERQNFLVPDRQGLPGSIVMPRCDLLTAARESPVTRSPRAAANIFAAIARSFRSTTARSASSRATWFSKISAAR